MNARTHGELARFIWGICNLLRGPYKRNEYRKVILPLTVLRRFDCVLAPTKQQVFSAAAEHKAKTGSLRINLLEAKIGYEIPLNRHFYVYEPPRPLEEIDADLQALEHEIISLLAEVTE